MYSATPHRSTDQKVEGSNPSGRATIYRRNLRFFNTFAVATCIRIFRFFCQKMGVFRGILHKICTKSAQYNSLLLLDLCIFGQIFSAQNYLSNNAVNAACDSLLTKCAYLVVIDISLCPKTFCTTRKFPVFRNSHVAVVWRNV